MAGPAETLVAELRDYPEWRKGRARYGVWVAPIDDPALLDYVDTARRQLADLIHPSPRRQPHLTVFVCGFHGAGNRNDDFSPQQLEHQLATLLRHSSTACDLPLAGLDSFASAAFIPVGDPQGRLAGWRQTLGETSREVRQGPYVPHITLGLYRVRVSAEVVRERLAGVPPSTLTLRVSELHYVTYDASDQLGALDTLHCVRLSGDMHVRE